MVKIENEKTCRDHNGSVRSATWPTIPTCGDQYCHLFSATRTGATLRQQRPSDRRESPLLRPDYPPLLLALAAGPGCWPPGRSAGSSGVFAPWIDHSRRRQELRAKRYVAALDLVTARTESGGEMSTQLKTRFTDRIFSSPVALAFVRSVVTRRGISEAQARKVYLDYLNRSKPTADGERRKVAMNP